MKYGRLTKEILISTLVCALICGLCGCGKKTVNYSVDDASTGEGTTEASADGARAAGKLADTLDIPVSCDVTFDDVAGCQISLVDDSIDVPDADSMGIVYYNSPTADSDDIGKIVESLLDRSKGIYITESDGTESGDESGDEAGETEPVKFTGSTYTYGTYTGEKNGTGYKVCVEADTDTAVGGLHFSYDYSDEEYERLVAQVDGATQVYISGQGGSDVDELQNGCSLSAEQAETLAVRFLDEMGITGLTCDEADISVLTVNWIDEDYEYVRTDADGYVVSFSRLIGGASVTDGEYVVDSSNSSGIHSMSYCSNDYLSVGVNDDGIVYAYGTLYVDPGSLETEKTELLSWNELLDVLGGSLAEYYTMHPTNYSKIEFNQAELAYIPYMDDDGIQCFVPVWVFREYDGDGWLEQAAYINAIDGSCIDLISYASKLGLYTE